MAELRKRQPKVCDYYVDEDSFSPGVAFCAGCALELNLRLISRVLGKDIIFVGTPSCSAPVLHGQNTMAWHKHAYYACTMTGVASSATGLSPLLPEGRHRRHGGLPHRRRLRPGRGLPDAQRGRRAQREDDLHLLRQRRLHEHRHPAEQRHAVRGLHQHHAHRAREPGQDDRLQEHAAGHGHARDPLRGHGHAQPPRGLRQEAGEGQGGRQARLRLHPRVRAVRGGLEDPGGLIHPGVPRRGEDQLLPALGDGRRGLPHHPEGAGTRSRSAS